MLAVAWRGLGAAAVIALNLQNPGRELVDFAPHG